MKYVLRTKTFSNTHSVLTFGEILLRDNTLMQYPVDTLISQAVPTPKMFFWVFFLFQGPVKDDSCRVFLDPPAFCLLRAGRCGILLAGVTVRVASDSSRGGPCCCCHLQPGAQALGMLPDSEPDSLLCGGPGFRQVREGALGAAEVHEQCSWDEKEGHRGDSVAPGSTPIPLLSLSTEFSLTCGTCSLRRHDQASARHRFSSLTSGLRLLLPPFTPNFPTSPWDKK